MLIADNERRAGAANPRQKGRKNMKTATVFAEVFTARTTGRRAMFTVNAVTVDALKIVLKGVQVKFGTEGAEEDERAGYILKQRNSGYYGGNDGYIPTAKGFREILNALNCI